MKNILLAIILLSGFSRCNSQNIKDTASVEMKKYLSTIDSSFKNRKDDKDFIMFEKEKINYEGKQYYIYIFGSNQYIHKSYNYIMFYECSSCKNKVLGNSTMVEDMTQLNKIYSKSTEITKETFVHLVDILINNYSLGRNGRIINRSDWNKTKQN